MVFDDGRGSGRGEGLDSRSPGLRDRSYPISVAVSLLLALGPLKSAPQGSFHSCPERSRGPRESGQVGLVPGLPSEAGVLELAPQGGVLEGFFWPAPALRWRPRWVAGSPSGWVRVCAVRGGGPSLCFGHLFLGEYVVYPSIWAQVLSALFPQNGNSFVFYKE